MAAALEDDEMSRHGGGVETGSTRRGDKRAEPSSTVNGNETDDGAMTQGSETSGSEASDCENSDEAGGKTKNSNNKTKRERLKKKRGAGLSQLVRQKM